jgi:ribosomal protein S18 acetylase RimI-like enzyme
MTGVSQNEIKTEIGLLEKDRESLADICWEAFKTKADWIYKNNVQKEKEVMRMLPLPENVIIARINDKIVGYLIFKTSQGYRVNKPLREVLRRHRNWRSILFMLLAHKPTKDEFYIFMIAVSSEARGMGVGTALLQRAYALARVLRLRSATLHVVQENPDAKRLYNREGFVEEKQLCLPWFIPRSVFGFKTAWFLRKPVT